MRETIGLLIALLAGGLISCNSSNDIHKEIRVRGIILDSITGKPISNARVTVLSWRRVHEEETYQKIDTLTNREGRFEVIFEEGFKIDIGSIAPNYHPAVTQINDLSKPPDIELMLYQNTATGNLKDLGQMAVFLREYKISPPMPNTYHGINLLNNTNTQSLDSMDIGFEYYSEVRTHKILIASANGGIIPIFNKLKSAIIEAPQAGYLSRYEMKGNEVGFFVKCRDGKTYARLMIFSLEYDQSLPYNNGSVRDNGIMFNVELQTEGREFKNANDIRLDYYILEHI